MKCVNKKIRTEYFNAIISGVKTFELRKDEDDIEVGDWICLQELDTKASCVVKVVYILRDFPGLEKGYAIYGIKMYGY